MNINTFLNIHGCYSNYYSETAFWDKVHRYAAAIGKKLIEEALVLYYAWCDPDTPAWVKTVIVSALGYLISPIDAIPDMIPVVGYTDDAGVIAAAIALVSSYLKKKHRRRAREKVKELFG